MGIATVRLATRAGLLRMVPGLLALTLASCGADDDADPNPAPSSVQSGGVGVGGSGGEDVAEACAEQSATRACTEHGTFGCIDGVQTCVDGYWSHCMLSSKSASSEAARTVVDPEERGQERLLGRPTGVENRAIGATCDRNADCDQTADPPEYCAGTVDTLLNRDGECAIVEGCGDSSLTTENACLQHCNSIAPIPPPLGPQVPGAGLDYGPVAGLPPGVIDQGLGSCSNDGDCQFDYHCASGTCVPSAPGYTNGCAGYDLTLGVPCVDGGDTSVVLCNRGTVAAPVADLNDYQLQYGPVDLGPYNSSTFAGCAMGAVEDTCDLNATADLAPGECMNVDCAIPLLNRRVYLDRSPNGECGGGCQNNYSFSTGLLACGQASCGGGVNVAETVPINMFTWIDRSGSMGESRQHTVCTGLQAFVDDTASEDMGWEMRFWPDSSDPSSSCPGASAGCNDSCDDDADYGGTFFPRSTLGFVSPNTPFNMPCVTADSGLQVFAGPDGNNCESGDAGGPTRSAFGLDGCTYNGTPTYAALQGAHRRAALYKDAHPDEAVVVVLVTDGAPAGTSCNGTWAELRGVATAARTRTVAGVPHPVYTKTLGIGIPSSGFGSTGGTPTSNLRTQMNNISNDGGTTAATFIDGTGDPSGLITAMNDLRNQFACNYTIPTGTDPNNVNVRMNIAGIMTTLTKVASCGAPGSPNTYSVGGSPLTVNLCPLSCTAASVVGNAVEVVAGCGAVPVTVTEHDVQTAGVDACAAYPGTYPQWTLMLYEADVPTGSSIQVSASTQVDSTSGWGPMRPIVEITSANEITDLTNPTDLTADIEATFPGGLGVESFAQAIDLQFVTDVTGGAPTLLNYEVQFTCAATE